MRSLGWSTEWQVILPASQVSVVRSSAIQGSRWLAGSVRSGGPSEDPTAAQVSGVENRGVQGSHQLPGSLGWGGGMSNDLLGAGVCGVRRQI